MKKFDSIALAYGNTIIDSVKKTSMSDSITLSEAVEHMRFSKTASTSTSDETELLMFSSNERNELRGFNKFSEDIGTHPDFKELESRGGEEYSYAVNVFVDIKGSTLLATKMSLSQVKQFKNKVLITAIQIFQAFGGHIQRLQGDAVYAVFCWKGIKKSDAIIAALNATSFLNYMIDTNNDRFKDKFGTSLAIRTGIDFGDDHDVLWSKYGILKCTEVTTTSLHTDLACKMQQHANDNEIIIGKNVKEFLDIPNEFCSMMDSSCFDKYDYQMFIFTWEKYLSSFSGNPNKKGLIHNPVSTKVFISCEYSENSNEQPQPYVANTRALSKNITLKFKINEFYKEKYDKIEWSIKNRGHEATIAKKRNIPLTQYTNTLNCSATTEYTGHHYIVCKIHRNGRPIAEEYFGIYVNDR